MKNHNHVAHQFMPQYSHTDSLDKVANDIFTFVNYETLKRDFIKEGLSLKENKRFYKSRVLRCLETYFKDKSPAEIEEMLRRMVRN